MPSKEFNPAEFAATIQRMRAGADASAEEAKPAFDPLAAAEHQLEAMAGRRPSSYEQALEHHGFFFVPAHQLPVALGQAPHQEGCWYHRGLRFAFTPTSLCTTFRGPEDFDAFVRDQKAKRAPRPALVLTR